MHYIVLDLEWNQCPDGKKKANPRLPFEILEIGAIKLDKSLRPIDTYHEIITPLVYHRLHHMTRSVIALSDQDLPGHQTFPQLIPSFFQWCGETYSKDYLICTYGSSDLTELQRNLDFYALPSPFSCPLFYLDIQKIFGLVTEGHKTTRSLKFAVDYFHLSENKPFHNAFSDALYTARIMQQLPLDTLLTYYSLDYYHLPTKKSEEIYLKFPTYSKYVSRPFYDIDSIWKDSSVVTCTCPVCDRRCRKKIRWFSSGSRHFLSLARCAEHGFFQSKLRVKSHFDGKVFIIRTQRKVDEEEIDTLRRKQRIAAAKKKSAKLN